MKYYINTQNGSVIKLDEKTDNGFITSLLVGDNDASYGIEVIEQLVTNDDLDGFTEADELEYVNFMNEKIAMYWNATQP